MLVFISTLTSIFKEFFTRNKKTLIMGNVFRMIEIIESFSLIEANKRLISPLNNRLKIVDFLLFLYIQSNVSALHYEAIPGTGFVGYRSWKDTFIVDAMKDSKYFWLPLFQRNSIFFLRYFSLGKFKLGLIFHIDHVYFYSGIIISFDFFGPKNRPISVWQYLKFIVEKYYRIILKMIGPMFVINILSIIGSGPNWHSGERFFTTSCQQNFWKNLIFINNLEADPRDYVCGKKLKKIILIAFFCP